MANFEPGHQTDHLAIHKGSALKKVKKGSR